MSGSAPNLRYSLTTAPFPMVASASEEDLDKAVLTVIAANPGVHPVTLQGMTVVIPTGPGATALTAHGANIGPVAPADWIYDATDSQPENGTFIFLSKGKKGAAFELPGGASLEFLFENVEINTAPGPAEVTVTERSNDCKPPDCPTEALAATKFPNGWGEVSFRVDPPVVPYDAADVYLHWEGPAGATYAVEYYTQDIVKIPADGDPALSPSGQYPSAKDPGIALRETTVFTLNVRETISGHDYHAQLQKWVTVEPPDRAKISKFVVSPPTLGKGQKCQLTWETNADQCCLDPGGQSVSAPNGSTHWTIEKTTTLTLTAKKGKDITQQTRAVTVVPPIIKFFTPTPDGPINPGDAVTLKWCTRYAKTVSITPPERHVDPSDSMRVMPERPTTYVLTCTGKGNPVNKKIKVMFNKPRIVEFNSRNASHVMGGDRFTIYWSVVGATSATINGIVVEVPNGSWPEVGAGDSR